ncbi:DUF4126 domain-containing protein [Leucobacter chinensis]|uniref:DUF4126 domain-containing protein n=1 Tax=Leucobacter chinensis TaxID=2851010 RepID=UPI001C235910|nr:DUF4126 domain-containing protein [Leucobacter chinensis]
MIAMLTGLLLATAAGLNAYVPLLALGLLARFTQLIDLPEAWSWIASDWALIALAVLFVIEVVVDKVPALDFVNDIVQTVVRPASGGMVFSAGLSSDTVSVADPEAFSDVSFWWPMVAGIVIALLPHLFKAIARPVLNTLSAGAAAPIVSVAEDTGAVGLSFAAIIAPLIGLVLLIVLTWVAIRGMKKARRARAHRANSRRN